MKEYAFGIDLGGTTAKVGLFTTSGALLEKWEVPTDTSNAGGLEQADLGGGTAQIDAECVFFHVSFTPF